MEKQKKLSIPLLIALVIFPQISETIYTPALPDVAQRLVASAAMVEATLAIYFIGFAIGVFIWGMISDRCGRRNAMLLGLLVYGTGTFLCGNASSVGALIGWRFLQAFGASVGSVISQTMLRDFYEGKQRIQIFSILSGALAFSPAIGPLLGGVISQFLGWRANFGALTVLFIVLTIWSFLSLPETKPKGTSPSSTKKIFSLFLQMMKNRQLWGHILLIGATNGILFGFYQEAPFIFIEQMGISPSQYGLFGILIAGATLFAARVSYQNSGRQAPEKLIQKGACCVVIGALLLFLTVLNGTLELNNTTATIVFSSLFLIFFGVGLIIPNSLSQALKPYQFAVGTAGSIFGGSYYCMIAGFTALMSTLHNDTALPLPLYILLLGVFLLFGSLMIRPARENRINQFGIS